MWRNMFPMWRNMCPKLGNGCPMWPTCVQCEEHVPNVRILCPMWGTCAQCWGPCVQSLGTCAQCDQLVGQVGEHVSNVTPKGEDHVPNLENISPMRGTWLGNVCPICGNMCASFSRGTWASRCVSSFPAHISGFPVLLLLLLFCSSSQIRCQFGRGVHHQLLFLIDFATSNLVSMYVQQQCSAFFSFFVLFFSVFWAANSSSSSYCTSFRFPFWVLCCFLSFGHEM